MTKKTNEGGRPIATTPETLQKLKEAFLMGMSREKIGDKLLFNFKGKNRLFITLVIDSQDEAGDFTVKEISRKGEVDLCAVNPYESLLSEVIMNCQTLSNQCLMALSKM